MKELQEQIGAWSTESPTEPGWYWIKGADTALALQVVAVDKWADGRIRVMWPGTGHVSLVTDVLECLWSGPLVQPEDSPKPALQAQWVPLSELRPGAIFETRTGTRGVQGSKSAVFWVQETKGLKLVELKGNEASTMLVREIVI